MKKILLITFILSFTINLNAQKTFKLGGSIGYQHFYTTVKINSTETESNAGTGYLSVFSEINLNKNFNLFQQVQYLPETESLAIPIQLEVKTKLINFLIGPQIEVSTQDLPDDFTNVTFSAIAGLSYNIDDNLKIICNYSYGITDNYTGNLNIETQNNILSFGMFFNFIK